MQTLIDKIQDEMLTDEADRDEQSQYLMDYYFDSEPETRNKIDLCFISLCGYSLKTMIDASREVCTK